MAQESNPDDAKPQDRDDRSKSDGCSQGKSGQYFYLPNDPKMFAALLTMANVMLTRERGRKVADEHARDIASRCFEKINSILSEDETGMKVSDAYLWKHVENRLFNLYKKLDKERSEAELRLPIDPDQFADPNSDDATDDDCREASRRWQVQVMVRRCVNKHLKKKRDRVILMEHYSDVPQAHMARRWKLSAPRIHQIIAKSRELVKPCLEDGLSGLEVA